MKKLMLILALAFSVIASQVVFAQEQAPKPETKTEKTEKVEKKGKKEKKEKKEKKAKREKKEKKEKPL